MAELVRRATILAGALSLRMERVGVARGARVLRGYLRVAGRERVWVRVRVPAGARDVAAWAGSRRAAHRRDGAFVTFRLPARQGRAADWAVTWR